MDVRDQAFWLRAARRKIVLDQIKMIQAVRAGMAEKNDCVNAMDELRSQLYALDGVDIVRENWEELRRRGRG